MAKNNKWPKLLLPVLGAGALAAATLARRSGATKPAYDAQRATEGSDKPRIVILGGGFAGLAAAGELARKLDGRASVLLVDRHNYHLFTPMLYQAATLGVDPYTVAYPLRHFLQPRNIAFRRCTVTGVDFAARCVQSDGGDIEYDYLVVALGTTTNFFGNKQAREHAFPLKWLEDGVAIRNRVVDALERAALSADEQERRALLTFVVVGGGATGVETAADLATLIGQVLPRDYPRIDPAQACILLIESEDKLLGHMGRRMSRVALDRLRALGVEVWLNAKAQDVTANSVATADGKTVQAHTILWTTGVQVPDVVAEISAEHGKGGSLKVDEYLRVCGQDRVYAAGDNAHFADPQTGDAVPLLAQAAVEEGRAVAANLLRAINGRPQEPFHFNSRGNVVALGHLFGVAEVGGITLGGFPGWLAWRVVHLVKISSFRNKLATLLDWSIGITSTRDTSRLEVAPLHREGTVESAAAQEATGAGA